MAIELGPHQIDAFRKMHNGSVLKGGVGTGKSRTALTYAYLKELKGELKINGKGEQTAPETPKDIIVLTTAKKRDSKEWEGEAAQFSISSQRESSIGGVRLVVDSWNNIANYTEVEGAVFIFDEQRLVGSGAWVKAFIKIAKANRWILLSATPGDTWLDYIPIFVANGFYKNRTEFLREHVVFSRYSKFPKVEGYRNTRVLERHRHHILVEMPFHSHTKRHGVTKVVDWNKVLFNKVWKDRWHVYEERPLKDVGEMFAVARRVSNSDPSRVGAVLELLEKHPRLIVFYNFNYELGALRVMSSTIDIPMAEWNGQNHQEIPEGDRWLYLVQYTAGAEGWNCITTDATSFFSLNYSWKIYEQAHGRIDRMNTPFTDLHYYTLRNDSEIDRAIWKSILLKKKFNEKEYVREHNI